MIKPILVVLIIIIIIFIINIKNKNNNNDKDFFNITNPGIPEKIIATQRNDVYDMSCADDTLTDGTMIVRDNGYYGYTSDRGDRCDTKDRGDTGDREGRGDMGDRGNRCYTKDTGDRGRCVQTPSKKVRFIGDNKASMPSARVPNYNKKTLKAIDTLLRTHSIKPHEEITLNKSFVSTQFNDAYRDVMTAINVLCPDLKIIFNLQTLPVTTTLYDTNKRLPRVVIDLITDFITKLNDTLIKLPETSDIINDYNNYLPLTAQLAKYTKNKGINKFYQDIGVDYNLYADTPENSIVQLIHITQARREFTEAETRYIITIVIKKSIKSVVDQMKLSINFVIKNDTMEGNGSMPIPVTRGKKVAIEFVFIDGYYTNDFNVDYECVSGSNTNKKEINNDGDDEYYPFNELGTSNLTSDHDIITSFNKKQREHEIQMNNFSENVPYPVTDRS
jgi:hypothetical protein